MLMKYWIYHNLQSLIKVHKQKDKIIIEMKIIEDNHKLLL